MAIACSPCPASPTIQGLEMRTWILLGLLVVVPQALWAADLPLWSVPAGFVLTPIADEARLNGQPIRMALLSGVMDPRSFQQAMERQCNSEHGDFHQAMLGSKTLWSCLHGDRYSQTLQWRQEGNRIVGELSTLRLDGGKQEPHPLPLLLPEAQILSDLETRDGSQQGRVVLAQSRLSIPQLRAVLLREAHAQGWRLEVSLSAQLRRLSLRKSRQALDIALDPLPLGGSRAVLVWQDR